MIAEDAVGLQGGGRAAALNGLFDEWNANRKGGTVEGHEAGNVNLCTLGLEIENLGQLHPDGEGLCAWPFGARAPHVGGGVGTAGCVLGA